VPQKSLFDGAEGEGSGRREAGRGWAGKARQAGRERADGEGGKPEARVGAFSWAVLGAS
jgi:hypothetical protein